MDNEEINTLQLKRIADATETLAHNIGEILQLVKADQEKYTAREAREKLQSEQTPGLGEYPGPPEPLAMAQGSRTMLQGASGKLQASSSKLDKIKL